jgi:hypothetical protein
MSRKAEMAVNYKSILGKTISSLFGLLVFTIGIINTFWGNDPGFGVFIILLSLAFFPPMSAIFKEKTGLSIPWYLKVLLGLFILWAALGVGELFGKIDLMMRDLH